MKKSVAIILSILLLIILSGCELVKKVPNENKDANTGKKSIVELADQKKNNPADHIFDIDLAMIQNGLDGKKLSDDDLNWTIKGADIITAEFGGGDLHGNELRSLYHLELKKPEIDEKYESGMYLYYLWENNSWTFDKYEQLYIEVLTDDTNRLEYDRRQELKEAYDSKPKAPAISVNAVNEEMVESTEGTDAVSGEEENVENTPVDEEVVEDTPVDEEVVENTPVDEETVVDKTDTPTEEGIIEEKTAEETTEKVVVEEDKVVETPAK